MWQQKCTKKEICFNIIWLAILNREEPEKKKNKLKVIAWDPLKERSNFTFSTLWNKYHDFFSTPEILLYVKKYWGREGREFSSTLNINLITDKLQIHMLGYSVTKNFENKNMILIFEKNYINSKQQNYTF